MHPDITWYATLKVYLGIRYVTKVNISSLSLVKIVKGVTAILRD